MMLLKKKFRARNKLLINTHDAPYKLLTNLACHPEKQMFYSKQNGNWRCGNGEDFARGKFKFKFYFTINKKSITKLFLLNIK